jgi:hypothetical protein
MLEGLKLKKIKKTVKAEPKKKFNFKTTRRAEGAVKEVDWLKDKTKQELVFLWKIGHVQRRLSEAEQKKFSQIKYYLKSKFNVEIPK